MNQRSLILGLIAAIILSPIFVYTQNIVVQKRHPILVLPVIASSIETGLSFGAAASGTFHLTSARDSATRTSNQQALILYTIKKQVVVAINGVIFFPGEKYILNDQISYSYFPDKFWGLGKTAPASHKEPYSYKQIYIYLHPQRLISQNLFLGLRYEYQRVLDISYIRGGVFDKENVSGRTDYQVSGMGISLTYDTRNNAFAPDQGVMLQGYFNHYAAYLGSDYTFTNFVIDLRKFIRLYQRQVLAFQAFGFFDAGNVPLRSLAFLGGYSSMRGYYQGRFIDKNMAIIQAEYRLPLFGRLGAVGFGDFGNVGNQTSELNLDHLKYSCGGGLRVALNRLEKLNLRLDYGIGRGRSNGFYLQLGEAF